MSKLWISQSCPDLAAGVFITWIQFRTISGGHFPLVDVLASVIMCGSFVRWLKSFWVGTTKLSSKLGLSILYAEFFDSYLIIIL